MMITPNDFPFLRDGKEKSYSYLDSAATTHKPQIMIEAMAHFYAHENVSIYRGMYELAEQGTDLYEQVRCQTARYINAALSHEIIFTANATDSLNFVAATWGRTHIQPGDSIVITELEHHANLLPWQVLANEKQAQLKYIPVMPDGTLDYSQLDTIIDQTAKLVSVTHCSNAVGTYVDLTPIIARARAVGAKIVVDGTQSVPHKRIDVHALDIDFLAFSAHKMLGPTGLGVLYIKDAIQSEVPPYRYGGGMIQSVDFYTHTWACSPQKYEAGTLPVAQVIGFGAALGYLERIDPQQLHAYTSSLCAQLIDGLAILEQITIVGPIEQLRMHGHIVSFVVAGWHPHDIAAHLDMHGIAVRAGDLCAQPLMKKLGYSTGLVRASFYLYNTSQDVVRLLNALAALLK